MVQRRSFLQGALAWPVATSMARTTMAMTMARTTVATTVATTAAMTVTGCSPSPAGLRIKILSQSVPVQLVSAFQRSLQNSPQSAPPPNFSSEANLQDLFRLLQQWQSPQPPKGFWGSALPTPDLMTLGDAWLGDAIRQNLIQPWTLEGLEGWQALNDRYRSVVTRNPQGFPDPSGEIWGLPYRWGTTAIAYRPSVFKTWGWEPQDWSDLWRSELQGQIGLPDDPREVIGLVLKSLGVAYNTPDPGTVPTLADRLGSLHRQVKFYSSTHLVQPLLVKDVALIVGWSTDLLPLTPLDRDIRIILPQSGTALWADLWVRPSQASPEKLPGVQAWVNFCWQPDRADLFSRFGRGTSPLGASSSLPTEDSPILNPSPEWLDRCEFVLPLSPSSQAAYQALWQTVRDPKLST